MSTAKRFADVKPGDVLSLAGQPLRVENSEAWSDHNWYIEGQLTALGGEVTSLILSNDAVVTVDSPKTDTLHLDKETNVRIVPNGIHRGRWIEDCPLCSPTETVADDFSRADVPTLGAQWDRDDIEPEEV